MNDAVAACRTCQTPLPLGAAYCPACGAATPTEISQATGEVRHTAGSADEAEQRARLQRIVGSDYRIGEAIGRGGFGVVFAARDLTLDRDVAVKALRPELVSFPALLERFKREARAAANLRHPNIIPIYAVGGGESIAYMVMPRIAGENLKVLLEGEEQLPVEDVRRILAEAGQALAVAHRAGIVHRDVKPENILLEGPQRHVYLTDFGIAKAVGSEDEGLTATGVVVGTPSYMSPEQAGGQPSIDHRSDIYSLGVLGFRMLTGRLPFAAEGLNDLIFQQITKEPPTVHSLRPEVPEFLAVAVDRCLARDPAERWESANEFVRAVTDETYVGTRPRKRRSLSWRAVTAVVGIGIAGIAAALVLSGRGAPAPADDVPGAGAATLALESTVTPNADLTTPAASNDAAGEQGPPAQAPPIQPPAAATTTPATPDPSPVQATRPSPPVERPTMGFLTVDAEPWGMVQIDGVNVKETPLSSHGVPPGIHVIRILKDGYVPVVDTVTVTAGNVLRRRYVLERQR
jgi:hypothetical protein